MLACELLQLAPMPPHIKTLEAFFEAVSSLTFCDHPLYPQFHVTELNDLSDEVILVPAGSSDRAGPG